MQTATVVLPGTSFPQGCIWCTLQELGASPSSVKDGVPSPTFNDGHPDPNLTYAKELVRICTGLGSHAL